MGGWSAKWREERESTALFIPNTETQQAGAAQGARECSDRVSKGTSLPGCH